MEEARAPRASTVSNSAPWMTTVDPAHHTLGNGAVGDAPLADHLGVPVPDGRRVNYNIISGTSMACPHRTSLASRALIKKQHPSWMPANLTTSVGVFRL